MRGNVDILCSSDIWRGGTSGGWGGGEGIFKNDNFIMKKFFKIFWSPVIGNIHPFKNFKFLILFLQLHIARVFDFRAVFFCDDFHH